MPAHHPVSFRLTPEAVALLERLQEHLGQKRSAVLERALRDLAKREKVTLEKIPKNSAIPA